MIRSFRHSVITFSLLMLTAGIVLESPSARAQVVKPFRLTGGGTAPDGIPVFPGGLASHNATGTATHLGRYSGDEGLFRLLSFDPGTLTGTFEGSFVFVAANGDRLKCNYRANPAIPWTGTFSGSLTPDGEVIVTFVQEFTPVPEESTGRFAKVIGGGFIMIAMSEAFPLEVDEEGYTPPFAYDWVGVGSLTFAKGH